MSQKLLDHTVLRFLWEKFMSLQAEAPEADKRLSGGKRTPDLENQLVSADIKAALKIIAMAARYVETRELLEPTVIFTSTLLSAQKKV